MHVRRLTSPKSRSARLFIGDWAPCRMGPSCDPIMSKPSEMAQTPRSRMRRFPHPGDDATMSRSVHLAPLKVRGGLGVLIIALAVPVLVGSPRASAQFGGVQAQSGRLATGQSIKVKS